MKREFVICANLGCYRRFEGDTPQEAADRLIAHKRTCVEETVAITEIREATFKSAGQPYRYHRIG